jgi:cytochrome c
MRRLILPSALIAAASAGLWVSPALAAGDPKHGFEVFKGTCGVCHLARNDVSRNDAATKIGPNLYGVVGRRAGTLPGFRYSVAMKSSGVVWTPDVLRRYALGPQAMIPNVRMSFPGLTKPQDADDVVAYLATLK